MTLEICFLKKWIWHSRGTEGRRSVISEPTHLNEKQLDAASYDQVASEFDRLTERFATPLAMRMLDLARLKPGDQVLDLGTGTGLVAMLAAPLVPGGRVIGIDHSPGMLRQASAKARNCGIDDGVNFLGMDAEHLTFVDGFFDVIFSLFALLHIPRPKLALEEMHRVLRPGGRIVIGVGERPSLFSISAPAQVGRRINELVATARGRLLTAPDFLHHLMREHGLLLDCNHDPRHPTIRHLLRQAGFRQVERRWLGRREKLDTDEFWRLQTTFDTRARMRLQQASAADIARLKQDFFARCEGVRAKNGALFYSYAAALYIGTRA